MRFSRDRSWQADEIGDFNEVYKCFQPCLLAVNCEGNLFVSDGTSGLVHEFAQDGSYLGELQAPESPPPINDLAFSNNGTLYAATSNRPNKEKVPPKVKGIARYQPNSGFVDPEEDEDKKKSKQNQPEKFFTREHWTTARATARSGTVSILTCLSLRELRSMCTMRRAMKKGWRSRSRRFFETTDRPKQRNRAILKPC